MEELIHVNNEKVSTSIEKLGNDSSLPAVDDMEIKMKPRLDLDSFEPYGGIDGAENNPESNSPHHETIPTEENTKTTPSSGEIRPLTPDSVANVSSCSSPMTPRGDSSSAPSTPRDGSSSGSPSPIPDDTTVDGEMASKPRLKLGKDLSMMMQALNGLQSPEEKIAALCKSYADLLDKQKLMQKQLRVSQRKQSQCSKEKDSLQTEHNKAVLAKGKLETLARELQKRNKLIKEEQSRKSLEEVALRKEMADDFQATLNRIEGQMKTAVERSNKVKSENDRMGGQFNDLVDKFKSREEALENLLKQSALQEQIAAVQLKKVTLQYEDVIEADQAEIALLHERIKKMEVFQESLCEAKTKHEVELRNQVQCYSEKFEGFRLSMQKSNELFATFQSEMDQIGKKLKKTEKEKTAIQKKWEASTKALADTVDYTKQLEIKLARLEKLSRALQAERNELAQRLRSIEGELKPQVPLTKGSKQEAEQQPTDEAGNKDENPVEALPDVKKYSLEAKEEATDVKEEELKDPESNPSSETSKVGETETENPQTHKTVEDPVNDDAPQENKQSNQSEKNEEISA